MVTGITYNTVVRGTSKKRASPGAKPIKQEQLIELYNVGMHEASS